MVPGAHLTFAKNTGRYVRETWCSVQSSPGLCVLSSQILLQYSLLLPFLTSLAGVPHPCIAFINV